MAGVPAARFPWQPGTLADDSCYVNKQNDFDRRGQYFDQKFVVVKGFGAKRLIKERFSPLWIHLRVNLVCIKSITNKTTNNRMLFITERIRRRRCLIYCL